jgi:hypothetical protein
VLGMQEILDLKQERLCVKMVLERLFQMDSAKGLNPQNLNLVRVGNMKSLVYINKAFL